MTVTLLSLALGWQVVLLVHLPVMLLAGAPGVWLFYVQHQFECAYWARRGAWNFERSAIEGSSYSRPADDPALVERQHRLPSPASHGDAGPELSAP